VKNRWKSFGIALLIIVAGGAARLPVERAYTAHMREKKLLETPLNLSMRDELGQTFFLAVLGGFRSVVASIYELKAITPWQQSNWGVVDGYYAVCTQLQPREEHYWESRAWHLAANARDTYLFDPMLTESNRHALAQQYVEKGIDVVRQGLSHLPDNWKLWDRLAYYLSMPWNEKPDHAAAAEYYAKAAAAPGGRRVYWRMHVYEVAKTTGGRTAIPGREVEAWDKLLALYNSGDGMDRTISVEAELVRLSVLFSSTHPEFVLPPELKRFLTDPALLLPPLTQEERRHSKILAEALKTRMNPEQSSKRRPPIVESPGLPKLR
jgi:hypothetical protein